MSLVNAALHAVTSPPLSAAYDAVRSARRVACRARRAAKSPSISSPAPRRHAAGARCATRLLGDGDAAGGVRRRRHFRAPPRRASEAFPEAGWWERAGRRGPRARSDASVACSPSTGSAPTARSTRRSTPPTRPTRSPRVLDALGIDTPAGLRRLLLRRDGRPAVRRAASGASAARWSRSAARIARIRIASAWRALQRRPWRWAQLQCDEAPRPVAGAAAGDAELPHAGGIRRALRRAPQVVDGRVRVRRRGLPRRTAARSTSRARRPPPSCACPNRSTCIASIPAQVARAGRRWSRSQRTGWCRVADCVALVEAPAAARRGCACCARATATTPSSRKTIAIAAILRDALRDADVAASAA